MRLHHKAGIFGALSALTLCLGIGGAELYHRAHPIERIKETHTVERIEGHHLANHPHKAKPVASRKRAPVKAKHRQEGDDGANDLNRRQL